MARICIITPGHLSTNPRAVKEADALSDAGHDVRVIAADFVGWAREADAEFADRPWSCTTKIAFGPRASLPSRVTQVARQRMARRLAKLGLAIAAIECAACHPIGPDLVQAARSIPADLYIAHYVAALPAAAHAARLHGAHYAFDAEDFHLGDLPDLPLHAFEKSIIRAIEGRYLGGCSYVTAASPGIADAYAETYGITRPKVILNVFPRSHGTDGATPRGMSAIPSIYWFSQTIGGDRGLECAIRAIGKAKSKPHLYLRGNISIGDLKRLEHIAADVGANDRLHILSPAQPKDMVTLAAAYDVGLVGETGATQNRRIALTNKQFTYLLAGLPVLMSAVPAHLRLEGELFQAVKFYPVDDVESLAHAIDAWFMNEPELISARCAAWKLGQERFNWDLEKEGLLEEVSKHAPDGAYPGKVDFVFPH